MQDHAPIHSPVTRVVHVPTVLLRDMQLQASRLERSVSWCVALAWTLCAEDVRSWRSDDPTEPSRLLQGRKRPETMTIPSSTWRQLANESARLDRSPSWLVQQAWVAARPKVREVPLERRSEPERRSSPDPRMFPPRPEGRRSSHGRRVSDPDF